MEGITNKTVSWRRAEIISQLEEYREKCEDELVERSNMLIELAELLESEYALYASFPERLEEINNSLDVSINNRS